MEQKGQGGLVESLHDALDEEAIATPAAVLALVYAARIDEAAHVRLPLEKALRTIEVACEARADDGAALDAFAKVSAALSGVSVARDLGPQLLATLDALLLTPKARAMLARRLPGGPEANPLDELRAAHDELQARRDRRNAGG